MITTTAAVLRRTGRPLQVEELTVPKPGRGQVLVKLAYSGVCASQLNEVLGLKGQDPYLPHTLGHEGSGVVERIGPGVTRVAPGDRVILSWLRSNGLAADPIFYLAEDGTRVNSGPVSTFLNRGLISENRLFPLPSQVPLCEAALLGCCVPTGAGLVRNSAAIGRGSTVAIFGMGGIGLAALLACRLAGPDLIVAVDVVDHPLQRAAQLGAGHCLKATGATAVAAIRALTDNRGVDFAIEASGNSQAMETAFQAVREGGGLCVLAGNVPHDSRIRLDPFDLIRGRQIRGSWGGDTVMERDTPVYADLFVKGDLPLTELIARTYPLEEINAALETVRRGAAGRVLIEF